MNCPFCSKTIRDEASICPHCEAIVDDSILGAMPEDANDDDEVTSPLEPAPRRPRPAAASSAPRRPAPATGGAAPRRPAPPAGGTAPRRPAPSAGATAPRRPAPGAGPTRRPAPIPVSTPADSPIAPAPAGSGQYGGKYGAYWTDDEPAATAGPSAARAERSPSTDLAPHDAPELGPVSSSDPLEQVKALWTAFLGLHFEDKVTCSSAVVLLVMCLMPWRSTPDGEDLGFLTWGFVSLLMGLVALGTIWSRHTGRPASVPSHLLPWVAAGAGGLAGLVAALVAIFSFERTTQFGKSVLTSSPSLGAFLALLAAGGIVLGGVLTARRNR